MCEVDELTKDIKGNMYCSDVTIQENGSRSTVSFMSNVEALRRRLYKAVKGSSLLNDQEVDKIAEDSLAGEGEETVADDAKQGSIPMGLVNQANFKERKYLEGMHEGVRCVRSEDD